VKTKISVRSFLLYPENISGWISTPSWLLSTGLVRNKRTHSITKALHFTEQFYFVFVSQYRPIHWLQFQHSLLGRRYSYIRFLNIYSTFLFSFLRWGHLARRPPFGLFHQPRMMDYDKCGVTSVEQSVEWSTTETEVLRENLPQCGFVNHKSHMNWPGLEPGPPRFEVSD
jgi:hypothetical protein